MSAALALVLALALQEPAEEPAPPAPAEQEEHAEQPPPLPAPTAAHRLVAGTRVSLVPPPGYAASRTSVGFENPAGRASILVGETGDALPALLGSYSDAEQLAQRGIRLVSSETHGLGPYAGHLLHLAHGAADGPYEKWVWLFGDDEHCVVVMATWPAEDSASRRERLRAAVLTAVWEPEREIDPFAWLGYRLDDTGGLRFLTRLSSEVLFTSDGEPDSEGTGKPCFAVGPSVGPVDTPEPLEFALRRIERHWLRDVEVGETEEVAIAGLLGYATVAHGANPLSGVRLLLYQVVLFEPDGHTWLLYGTVAADQEERWLPAFERMARSLRFDPPAEPASAADARGSDAEGD